MIVCPRCQAPLTETVIQCPRCKLPLKAYGHPGIPLHRADGEEYLCSSCLYHLDDSCTFPQRPLAQTCTLYQSAVTPKEAPPPQPSWQLRRWLRQHGSWLALATLLGFSLLIALSR